jgi:hypothetical protein
MKNKALYLLLCISVIFACQKDQLDSNTNSHTFLENVTIKNGRLHFPTKAQFYDAEEALNQEERINLINWHNEIGFYPMQRLYNKVNEDFKAITSLNQYQSFLDANSECLHITQDSAISINGYNPFLSQLLNIEGEIMIGGKLIKYVNGYVITIDDGSQSNLNQATRSLQSDDSQGIHVREIHKKSISRYCSNINFTMEGWAWCGNILHRTTGHYYIDNSTEQVGSLYDITSTLRTSVCVHYQGFLGFWYNGTGSITWQIGWGAICTDNIQSPDIAHGTGWTAYNVHQVTYFYRIRPNWLRIQFSQIERYSYKFSYTWTDHQTGCTPLTEQWCQH